MTAVATAELVDVDPYTDRAAWLDWRRGGIGASDIAGLLGIGRWSSPWSVWADKVGLLPEEPPSTVMKAGNYFEDGVRRWFADETGLAVTGAGAALQSTARPIVRCTADGAIAPAAGLEIKVEGPGRAWEVVPDQYQAQGQWQMATAGWERVHFAVLHGRTPDFGQVLERDETDIEFMLERAEQFWVEHVVAGVPPQVDGSDATERALKAVYPDHTPGERVDLGELAAVVEEWRSAGVEKRAAEAREKEARNRLLERLGDAELGCVDGVPVVSCRTQSRADIDKARLKKDHPRIVADYATATSFRVLRNASKSDQKEHVHGRS